MSRHALISGGTRGIGSALALALARQGWSLSLCYRHDESTASTLRAELAGLEAEVFVTRCDVSEPAAARSWVDDAAQRTGRIDALINAVGPFQRGSLLEQSDTAWRRIIDTNLNAVFSLSQAAMPHLQRQARGRIINFGLAGARQARAQSDITAYCIAKLGVSVLTRSLAKLGAPEQVTANCIAPGFIDTGSQHPELAPAIQRIPAGRLGRIDEVVSLVLFLLSEQADYINGAEIEISGGWD